MSISIAMPRLSDSMEEGTVVRWLVDEGGAVTRGDVLAEIETDKATMEFEAEGDGRLHRIAAEGETLAVGVAIAELLGEGEEPSEDGGGEGVAGSEAGEAEVAGEAPDAGGEHSPGPPGGSASRRVKASPLARRVARDLGVDLDAVSGSGPGGRVVRADVEAVAARGGDVPPAAAVGGVEGVKGSVEVVEPTRVQQVIARRMGESKATIPDFQVRVAADVTDLLALRGELKAAGRAVSVNDFVVKACGLALGEFPRANGAFVRERFELYSRVNVGVAVAGEGTLVVPTVFDADAKPVTQIAVETRELAGKVRDNAISPSELEGGTFTVSNLGMFGIESFTAVVNPGQAAILAVGAATLQPTLGADGAVTGRSLMDLSLSCDHRILYGADAARFLARIQALLQTPHALVA